MIEIEELDRSPAREPLDLEASRIALAVTRAVPDRGRRLTVAIRLVLATVDGMGLSPLDAVAWLRQPPRSGAGQPALPPEQVAGACLLAEQEFFAREDALLRLRGDHTGAAAPGAAGYWQAQVAGAYRAEPAAPADATMRRPLSRLLADLGLTRIDECYLTWLVSLVLARSRPHVPFADDGVDALDRAYHEHSKFSRPVFARDQEPGPIDRAAMAPPLPAGPVIDLPTPAPATAGTATAVLADVLRARTSQRTGYHGALAVDQLALLLGLAVGRATPVTIDVAGQRYQFGRLTYPSAGARYPIRTYVLIRAVDGIAPGIYCYQPRDHALAWVGPAPDRATLQRVIPALASTPDDPMAVQAADAPAFLIPVADLSYQRERYGLRSYRLVSLECGHLAQNLCLVATALGLACITIASFFDDLLAQVLGLDGVHRAPLYVLPIGPGAGRPSEEIGPGPGAGTGPGI